MMADIIPTKVINRVLEARADYPNYTTLKEFYETLNEEVPYPYLKAVLDGFHLL